MNGFFSYAGAWTFAAARNQPCRLAAAIFGSHPCCERSGRGDTDYDERRRTAGTMRPSIQRGSNVKSLLLLAALLVGGVGLYLIVSLQFTAAPRRARAGGIPAQATSNILPWQELPTPAVAPTHSSLRSGQGRFQPPGTPRVDPRPGRDQELERLRQSGPLSGGAAAIMNPSREIQQAADAVPGLRVQSLDCYAGGCDMEIALEDGILWRRPMALLREQARRHWDGPMYISGVVANGKEGIVTLIVFPKPGGP